MKYLVVVDVPGIKEYVFGTDRLVQIRGASAILDVFNRREMTPFFHEQLGAGAITTIFANGGQGQFLIEAAAATDLEDTLKALNDRFYQKTQGGARLVWGWSDLTGSSYQDALDQAFLNLKTNREEYPFNPGTLLHTGFIRECDTCSRPAGTYAKIGEDQVPVCKVCAQKGEEGRGRGLWQDWLDYLQRQGVDPQNFDQYLPRDFEKIGERCGVLPGYTALVYADGNGMGRLIKGIEEPEQFEFFSMTVDQAIREACYEALWKFCRPCLPSGAEAGEERIPADILLLGGDDLMVYLAADRALDFALMVAQEFEARTQAAFANAAFFKEKLKGKGVTISLGIAYGKSHTPFAVMLDQAGELLKTAKAKGATDPTATELYSPSYLDYHFTSFFNQLSVQNCRQAHLTFTSPHRLRLYQKPYSLEDAQKLRDWARELSGIPRSRRHRLGTAAYLGKPNGTLEFLKAFVRSKEEHRPIIRRALEQFGCFGQHLPWNLEADNSFSTVLVDLIELTELSSKELACTLFTWS